MDKNSLQKKLLCLSIFILWTLPLLAQEPDLPRITADVWPLIDKAGNQQENNGADAVTVLDRTDIMVEESGLGHTNIQQIVKILSDAGAANYTRLRFDYDPASNMVDVESVRIYRQNGTIEEIGADQILDLPQPQAGIVWGARMKLVPLNRLEPGDAVEYNIYKKGFMIAYLKSQEAEDERFIPPMRGHFYDLVYFQDSQPIKLKYYRVRTRRDKPLQFETYNGSVGTFVSFDDEHNIYTFWQKNTSAFKGEPNAPSRNDLITKIVMATVPNWQEKSRWFFEVNEPVFAANAEIEALYHQITKGLKTDEEKFLALQAWSAQEIRYFGITMGKGEGYTIHPGVMTFNDRCGVCKDKAGMLITLLRAGGYTVYPAMTMAGERVERIPADQFNHCVVAVQQSDGEYFMLDPTWATFSREFWNSSESEQFYLIGSPEGETLQMTPLVPAETNWLLINSEAKIKDNGDLEGKITVSGDNYIDQRLRRTFLQGAPAQDRGQIFRTWVKNIAPQAELQSFPNDYATVLDLSKPIEFKISYRIPNYAVVTQQNLVFVPPGYKNFLQDRAMAFLNMAKSDQRNAPIFLWFTRHIKIREKIQLPNGFKPITIPENKSIEFPAASCQFTSQVHKNEFRFESDLKVKLRTVPVDHYPGLKKVVDAVNELANGKIILGK